MRLIDADALKKRLQEQQKYGSVQDSPGRAKAIVEVIHAPTIEAEPVRRWIPCSERLPEKDTSVLIYAAGHRVTAYYDAVICAFRLTKSNDLFYLPSAVTHWMPLPEKPETTSD